MDPSVAHETRYEWDEPVPMALQQHRLTPRSGAGQEVTGWRLAVEGGTLEAEYDDRWGARVALVLADAGVDNVSIFPEVLHLGAPGEHSLIPPTAGNPATTQAVVSMLEERFEAPADGDPGILAVPSMFQAARLVGETLREVIVEQSQDGAPDPTFSATILLAGQIAGSQPRLALVHPEGNFIEASDESPWLQMGETKYGRPILVRAFDSAMSFEAAVKLLLSFGSTIKANLSVAPPLDLAACEADSPRAHFVVVGRQAARGGGGPARLHVLRARVSAHWGRRAAVRPRGRPRWRPGPRRP